MSDVQLRQMFAQMHQKMKAMQEMMMVNAQASTPETPVPPRKRRADCVNGGEQKKRRKKVDPTVKEMRRFVVSVCMLFLLFL